MTFVGYRISLFVKIFTILMIWVDSFVSLKKRNEADNRNYFRLTPVTQGTSGPWYRPRRCRDPCVVETLALDGVGHKSKHCSLFVRDNPDFLVHISYTVHHVWFLSNPRGEDRRLSNTTRKGTFRRNYLLQFVVLWIKISKNNHCETTHRRQGR